MTRIPFWEESDEFLDVMPGWISDGATRIQVGPATPLSIRSAERSRSRVVWVYIIPLIGSAFMLTRYALDGSIVGIAATSALLILFTCLFATALLPNREPRDWALVVGDSTDSPTIYRSPDRAGVEELKRKVEVALGAAS